MEQALATAAVPAAALLVSVLTFVFTQIRAQRTEDRSAARDTVEVIASLNQALTGEVDSLRQRLQTLEQQRDDCERNRVLLLEQIAGLRAREVK